MTLTAKQIKELLKEGYSKYLILHHLGDGGKTYLVKRSNPTNVLGSIRRTVINDFNTQQLCQPIVYYEFQDSEVFKHNRG